MDHTFCAIYGILLGGGEGYDSDSLGCPTKLSSTGSCDRYLGMGWDRWGYSTKKVLVMYDGFLGHETSIRN